MPLENLQQREKEIRKYLQRNTLIAGISTLAGFGLLVPAFSVEGSKFDYQRFCFNPEIVYSPEQHNYCQGQKLRKGIAWRVALERSNSQEFRDKVYFIDRIPAQNPTAGVLGLASGAFFLVSFFLSKDGTQKLQDDLDVLVSNKKILLFERDLEQQLHLNLKTHQTWLKEDYLKSQISRGYGEQKYYEMSEPERELAAKEQLRIEELKEANFNLQLATIENQTTKEQAEAAEHRNKVEKLIKSNPKNSSTLKAGSDAARLEEVTNLLKEHEDGWFHVLCTTRKVLIIEGEQGSFKSYTAALIAFLRYHLKGHKLGWIVDSDYHQNKNKAWKILQSLGIEAYGANKNGEGIREGIERFLEGIKNRNEDNDIETIIFDELTTYGDYQECEDVAKNFMKFALSAPRKAAYGLIAVTHSMTNEGTGKGSGMSEARKRGSLHLLLNADNDYNPTFKGVLNGLKDESGQLIEDKPVTLPDWFRPDKIASILQN